jgi:hypothetical protein
MFFLRARQDLLRHYVVAMMAVEVTREVPCRVCVDEKAIFSLTGSRSTPYLVHTTLTILGDAGFVAPNRTVGHTYFRRLVQSCLGESAMTTRRLLLVVAQTLASRR